MGWELIVSTLIASLAYITPKLLAIYAQMSIVQQQIAALNGSGSVETSMDWTGTNQPPSDATGGGYV